MTVARVLTIAGSDSGGGAGIQADLKTIAALGGFGMSVVTALTAQNTLGVQGVYEVSPDFVAKQFDAVATDIGVDAAKTGMLGSPAVLAVVAGKIRQYGIEKLVVDPVLASTGGVPLIRSAGQADAIRAFIGELIPLALVVTPNIPEAELLAGIRIVSLRDMEVAAAIIGGLGAKNVVVTGGHLRDSAESVDILYDGKTVSRFSAARIAARDTHGTGCTFSAALAAGLAAGKGVPEAVGAAKKHITAAIRCAWRVGGGRGPVNHSGDAPGIENRG